MAWYQVYQYAELKTITTPGVMGKVFPVLAWEIASDNLHILAVKLMISDKDHRWFDIGQVNLFKSNTVLTSITEGHASESRFNKFLRSIGLKGR